MEWVVGSHVQYLTKVQGMPKNVEVLLTMRIQNFVWGGKKLTVNIATLYRPCDEEGLNLLDLPSRVTAINLT